MGKIALLPILLNRGLCHAGVYGALHHQISYTVSPDYFHAFKFHQLGIPERMRGRALRPSSFAPRKTVSSFRPHPHLWPGWCLALMKRCLKDHTSSFKPLRDSQPAPCSLSSDVERSDNDASQEDATRSCHCLTAAAISELICEREQKTATLRTSERQRERRMALGVQCECGICLPVAEEHAGSAITCSCGRRVVVPLLEEFRDRSLLLSAATLERRVQRLIAAGALPTRDACLKCGDLKAQVVNVNLQCERYAARASGGLRFWIIPVPWGIHWAIWQEEKRVEIQGRDTDVRTPVAFCAACHHQLLAPTRSSYLWPGVLLAAGAILGYFHLLTGIGLVAVGLALLALKMPFALRSWQRELKGILRKVPVYRQVLERYPRAVVVIPTDVCEKTTDPH